MVESETLILIIQKYEGLWNNSLGDYQNKNIRDNLWESVCRDAIENWDDLSPDEKQSKCKYFIGLSNSFIMKPFKSFF